MSEDTGITYDRAALVALVVHHQQTPTSDCYCGWRSLGASWAEHFADAYELLLKRRQFRPTTNSDVVGQCPKVGVCALPDGHDGAHPFVPRATLDGGTDA